jgi:hypothetical protein
MADNNDGCGIDKDIFLLGEEEVEQTTADNIKVLIEELIQAELSEASRKIQELKELSKEGGC